MFFKVPAQRQQNSSLLSATNFSESFNVFTLQSDLRNLITKLLKKPEPYKVTTFLLIRDNVPAASATALKPENWELPSDWPETQTFIDLLIWNLDIEMGSQLFVKPRNHHAPAPFPELLSRQNNIISMNKYVFFFIF